MTPRPAACSPRRIARLNRKKSPKGRGWRRRRSTVFASYTRYAEGLMANRLAQERSPYLLQHANNPVDWYAWGDEAFAAARSQDRPIFLSIGYSTCHWCHVMEHESF